MMKLRLSTLPEIAQLKGDLSLGTVLTDKLLAGLSHFLPLFGSQFPSVVKEGIEQNNVQP